ncbi:oxysterol-binding protein 2 isoform X5 [Mustela lutreola]|uniref:oxysterol-binding protein 2 isoform X5 n=1 Tax=Mustela lutreola TaxID=9666 RepID=UPI00279718B4|nr:oxysterol-binding protein 2 isoform X5 [Mustela lutreola]
MKGRGCWESASVRSFCSSGCLNKFKKDDSGDDDDETASPADKSELHCTIQSLSLKLDDLSTCNDLIAKHGAALQRSLSELDGLKIPYESSEKLKAVNERATLFRITSNAMINACRDFLELAETHSRKWQRALQYEQEQRIHLEETIEQLAKQHNSLERAFRSAPGRATNPTKSFSEGDLLTPKGEDSEEDEDTEYFDAMEDSTSFITVITEAKEDRKAEGGTTGPVDWTSSDNVLDGASLVPKGPPKVKRRVRIPDKPNYSLNLWSIMKNCIGRELSKIPMPVNFNEPLSMLQRLTEDLEYHHLLDKAVHCTSSVEQMCLVAAFSVSSYSTTVHRIAKPFNPMLGETFELDRLDDMGLRSLCEQVSHHPPSAAHYVFSKHGWSLWQEITISSKFRGKYLSIMPLGAIHLEFQASGNHYVWRKSTSTVHNIIVGKLWIDQTGDIEIVNHKTQDRCQLKFLPYSYFSKEVARKVTGVVSDSQGKAHYVLSGSWDEQMECAKIVQSSPSSPSSDGKQKTVYQTLPAKLLWKKYPLPENAENMYYFSELALTLNEHEEGVAPTDSRLRPDQRLMEKGHWDEANTEKQRLEEKQRLSRRRRLEACSRGCGTEEAHPLCLPSREGGRCVHAAVVREEAGPTDRGDGLHVQGRLLGGQGEAGLAHVPQHLLSATPPANTGACTAWSTSSLCTQFSIQWPSSHTFPAPFPPPFFYTFWGLPPWKEEVLTCILFSSQVPRVTQAPSLWTWFPLGPQFLVTTTQAGWPGPWAAPVTSPSQGGTGPS